MLHVPNLILIGAGGRNAGKTTLACALIRRLQDTQKNEVIGLKITSVKEQGSLCPRGGHGCGACALDRPFVLCEETSLSDGAANGKDTVQLLRAGAKKVYWLRALRSALEEGFTAFLEKIKLDAGQTSSPIGQHQIILCESNSLRSVIKPAIFIMLQDAGEMKDSARQVAHYADMTIKAPFSESDIDMIIEGKELFRVMGSVGIVRG
jgi:molybdopterin-guanine dinucleotide biosynthesis protein